MFGQGQYSGKVVGKSGEICGKLMGNSLETRGNLALNEGPVLNLITVKLVKQEKYLRGNGSSKN